MNQFDREITETLKLVANSVETPDFVIPGQEPSRNGSVLKREPLRSSVRIWGRRRMVGAASAAGMALLGVLVLTYISPVFASYVYSLFQFEKYDQGLRQAAGQGFSQTYHQEVSDQNLTIEIAEIIADPTQVAIAYRIKDTRSGAFLSPDLIHSQPENGFNELYLVDREGNRMTNGYGGSIEQNVGFLKFNIRPEWMEKAPLVFRMNVKQVGKVAGSWVTDVPISFNKATAATRQIRLEDSWVSSNGLHVKMNHVVFAPTNTRIEFQTSWTDVAIAERKKESQQLVGKTQNKGYAPYLPYQEYSPEFHIEDSKGVKIKTGLLLNRKVSYDRYGHFLWNLDVLPLTQSETYLLVLDAIHQTEPADLQFQVDSAKLRKAPVTKKLADSMISIKSIQTVTKQDDSQAAEIKIEVLSKELSNIHETWWMIRDGSGKVYAVTGSSTETIAMDPDGAKRRVYKLTLPEMRSIPDKLDITLQAVTKRYPAGNWKIKLSEGNY